MKEQQSTRALATVTSNHDCYGANSPAIIGEDEKIEIDMDKYLLSDTIYCPKKYQPIAYNMNEEVVKSSNFATKDGNNIKYEVAPLKLSADHDWLADWLDRQEASMKTVSSLDDLEPRPFPDDNRLENLLFTL